LTFKRDYSPAVPYLIEPRDKKGSHIAAYKIKSGKANVKSEQAYYTEEQDGSVFFGKAYDISFNFIQIMSAPL